MLIYFGGMELEIELEISSRNSRLWERSSQATDPIPMGNSPRGLAADTIPMGNHPVERTGDQLPMGNSIARAVDPS